MIFASSRFLAPAQCSARMLVSRPTVTREDFDMRAVASSEAREVEVVRAEGTGKRFDYIGSPGLINAEPQAFLVGAGKELAGLLAGELPRLSGLLRRLSP